MTNSDVAAAAVFFIVLAILGLIFGPLISIWAVNTLFGTAIAFTLKNWFAMFLLILFFGKGSTVITKGG